MAKEFQVKMKCVQVNARENGGNVVFAHDVKQEDTQVTAQKTIQLHTSVPEDLEPFKPGQNYTITIK
jgi:hypothetical protein